MREKLQDEKSSTFQKVVRKFLEELSEDIVEERVVLYVVREIQHGRSLRSILQDPYVRNRVDEEKLAHVLERPEVIKAVEDELGRSFKQKDFKFKE